jgi:DNA-binding NarL/FixJ family response regulator
VRAVALAHELRPNVVLMDLRMPEMDGISATSAIMRELPETRIIALTTYSGDADVRRALKAGARGYLLKDMLIAHVVNAVRSVHLGQRVLPTAVAERLAEFPYEVELTPRETEVLSLVARGYGNKEVAVHLQRSDETVKAYLKSIFSKLGVDDRTAAVTTALSRGLIRLEG